MFKIGASRPFFPVMKLAHAQVCSGRAGVRWQPGGLLLAKDLHITRASYRRYDLPLVKPLTTGSDKQLREGFLLQISAESADGRRFMGVGEIAPLPGEASWHTIEKINGTFSISHWSACLHVVDTADGECCVQGLHKETLLEAEEQLRLLLCLLPDLAIPHGLALMQVISQTHATCFMWQYLTRV
jgi:hypothetical protein